MSHMARRQIHQLVQQLPPFPDSTARLLATLHDAAHASSDVARVVASDPALTVRVLGAANSPGVGSLEPVNSVERAVSLLGERTVVALAVELAAGPVLSRKLDGYAAPEGTLLGHGLRTGILARILAESQAPAVEPPVAFTAGLLLDVGKALMSLVLGDRGEELVGHVARGEARDFLEAERRAFGVDHCELGLEVASVWSLPSPLAAAIGHHHRPGEAPEVHRRLVAVTHVADVLARTMSSSGLDAMAYRLDLEAAALLSLDAATALHVVSEAHVEFEAVGRALEFPFPGAGGSGEAERS